MGMQKPENWPYGGTQPTANYHRITNFNGDPKSAQTRTTICSWYDKASRDAGDDHYKRRDYSLGLTDIMADGASLASKTDACSEAYTLIKASDEHEGFFKTGVTDIDPD